MPRFILRFNSFQPPKPLLRFSQDELASKEEELAQLQRSAGQVPPSAPGATEQPAASHFTPAVPASAAGDATSTKLREELATLRRELQSSMESWELILATKNNSIQSLEEELNLERDMNDENSRYLGEMQEKFQGALDVSLEREADLHEAIQSLQSDMDEVSRYSAECEMVIGQLSQQQLSDGSEELTMSPIEPQQHRATSSDWQSADGGSREAFQLHEDLIQEALEEARSAARTAQTMTNALEVGSLQRNALR